MNDFKFSPVDHTIFRLSFTDLEYNPAWMLDASAFRPSDIDGTLGVSGLQVEIDASHIGYVNKNWKFYIPGDASAAAKTFTSPYGKPVMRHHGGGGLFGGGEAFEDPIGRVIEASVHKLVPGKMSDDPLPDNIPQGVVRVVAKIGDEESAQKILDGRYSTVSVRATPAVAICSICNRDWLAPPKKKKKNEDEDPEYGPCDHWPGKSYEGNLCYLKFGKYEYGEVSFVNFPADVYAAATAYEEQDSINVVPARIHVISGAQPMNRRSIIMPVSMDASAFNKDSIIQHKAKEEKDMAALEELSTQLKEAQSKITEITAERDSLSTELDKVKTGNENLLAEVKSLKTAIDESAASQRKVATDTLVLLRTLNGAYGKNADEIEQAVASARERMDKQNLDALHGMLVEEGDAVQRKLVGLAVEDTDPPTSSVGDTDGDDPPVVVVVTADADTPAKKETAVADFLIKAGVERIFVPEEA